LEEQDVEGRIIWNTVSKKYDGKVRIELIWLRIEVSGGGGFVRTQ
jgi:hypothetical protein